MTLCCSLRAPLSGTVVNQCLEFGYVASTVSLYPNLSEGADCVSGQLRGDKECPFSGATNSARVWRTVPESDARSVLYTDADTSTPSSCVL